MQKLTESMIYHLKKAISEDIKVIDSFLNNGIELLNMRPQTHEEIGEAYRKHAELSKDRRTMVPLLEKAELKNRLLRSVASGGHEQLFQTQIKMEKFQTMIESHQQVLRDQTEILKKNLIARIESFNQNIEKLSARWSQFKPKDSDLEDEVKCIEALKIVKEKDTEVQERLKEAQKIRQVLKKISLSLIIESFVYY
jgi:dynein heavy chain 2, cytosolic